MLEVCQCQSLIVFNLIMLLEYTVVVYMVPMADVVYTLIVFLLEANLVLDIIGHGTPSPTKFWRSFIVSLQQVWKQHTSERKFLVAFITVPISVPETLAVGMNGRINVFHTQNLSWFHCNLTLFSKFVWYFTVTNRRSLCLNYVISFWSI